MQSPLLSIRKMSIVKILTQLPWRRECLNPKFVVDLTKTKVRHSGFELAVGNSQLRSVLAVCEWVFAFFLKIANR